MDSHPIFPTITPVRFVSEIGVDPNPFLLTMRQSDPVVKCVKERYEAQRWRGSESFRCQREQQRGRVFFPINRGLKKSPDLFLVSSFGVPIEKCGKPWLFGVIMYVHI